MKHIAFLTLLASMSTACASLPAGDKAGADEVARAIEKHVNKPAWDQTGAVKFGFRKQRTHVWDKERGFFHMTRGDEEVWLDLWDRGGFASTGGVDVTDDVQRRKLLDDAWTFFCNDTFWLNPLVKLFDEGVTRELVSIDDQRGLKVSYASGGKTPGDAYVWLVDESNKPYAVRMWVSALPTKGIEFSWTSWTTLQTGALVGTSHHAGPIEVTIDDPAGATTLSSLEPDKPDRFANLAARRVNAAPAPAAAAAPATPPATAPHNQ